MAAETEVDFGNLTPSPNGCSLSGTDSGYVCASTQSFTVSGDTFAATGFDNPFAPGGALTLKPLTGGPLAPPANSLAESGLGENTTPPGTPCSSTDCAIDSPRGISVAASGSPINDAIVGSVDSGDTFNFFTGPTMTFLGMFDDTCTSAGVAGTCLITFPDTSVIWLQTDSGSVLLTAISADLTVTSTPEPTSIALFGSALLSISLLYYRRRTR